jgi:predicted nucleotidyltransferase
MIVEICKRHRVKRVALFGSALREDFDPARSDIDLLIDFEPLAPGEHARTYLGLIVELEALLGRSVDVVERRTLRGPYLRRDVESLHEVLYDAA